MSITLRPYRGGGWEVDITLPLPDGSRHRERKRVSQCSKSAARRWAEDRERYLLQHGPPTRHKEVLTLETFARKFVDGHARANRHKPSGINSSESILKWHLIPTLGPKHLDAITNEQVQRLKLALADRAPKTVNNGLTVLSTLLRRAAEWGELARLPWVIKLLPNPKKTTGLHDFEQHERLLTVARGRGAPARAIQELAGHADLSTMQRYMHLSPAATSAFAATLLRRDSLRLELRARSDVVSRCAVARTRATSERADASEPRERSGDHGAPRASA